MGIDSSSKFTKNARVEVTSEEEGFTGAWYLAKIIDPFPKKRPNQFYVQYETLLDENSAKPLKEFVNCSLVRPIPPQEIQKIQSFQLDDAVDAFYKDGWWTGVITNVFEGNSRFEVTFSNPPDLIVFPAGDLRLHRDWINGKWTRPKKNQRITGLLFSIGKKVEVSFSRVEHSEVWFPAIVQEDTGNGSFLVEYQCLGKNGEPESLKVVVDSLHIRPSPPQLKGKNYDLLEKVDAYIEFGWWSGVLTKELPDNKYLVFFNKMKKERLLSQSEIRPHMEWKEGNWFSTSQDISTTLDYQGLAKSDNLNVHQTEARTADFLNSLDIRTEWVTPSKEMEHSNNSNLPILPKDRLYSSLVKASGDDIHLISNSTNGGARTSNIEQSKFNLPSENFSRGKRARTKRHKVDEPEYHAPQHSKRSVGRPPKSRIDKGFDELEHYTSEQLGRNSKVLPIAQISNPETQGDKNGYAVNCTEENFVQKDSVTEVPITRNPEKEVIEGSQAEILSHPAEVVLDLSGGEHLVHNPPVEGIKEADQLERQVESTGKRKRGRPPKLQKSLEVGQLNGGKNLAKGPEVAMPNGGVTAQNRSLGEVVFPVVVGLKAKKVDGSVNSKEMIGVDKKILNGLVDKKSKSSSKTEVYPAKKDKLQSKKGIQVSVGKQARDSSKRGRRTPIIDAESPNQDSEDLSAKIVTEVDGKGSSVKEAETSTVRSSLHMSDDQPLRMWLDCPKTADATSVSQGRNVEKQCITNFSKDIVVLPSQCDDQNWPFAKTNYSLWNSLESEEAFRLVPQTPHFQSLFSQRESSREGAAIASMVNFSNVFKMASNLQPDCPRNTIEDALETLLDLENDGFMVNVVRDRFLQLLSAKDKVEGFVAKAKETTDQIEEIDHDQSMIDLNIKDIQNRIRLLQEECALALSKKAEQYSTIAHLKSKVSGLNDSIRNAELEFTALVATPWQV
ncbi:hypothetical protein ACET3Z_005704 [Daucus carota]